MPLITCQNATFAYDGKPTVEGLNLQIEQGNYLCVVGENGSGKSTLVKGILGLLAPRKGRIVFGEGLRKSDIGYLPQRNEANRNFPATVWEVVASGCRGAGPLLRLQQKRTIMQSIELLSMAEYRQKSFQELSGGQQQRVLLARALCAAKRLLLLDEPVAGLDPLITKELYQTISMLHERGMTVVMISHDIHAATQYGTHIFHLGHGGGFFGTVQEYLDSGMGKAFAGGHEHAESC